MIDYFTVSFLMKLYGTAVGYGVPIVVAQAIPFYYGPVIGQMQERFVREAF